jgi:hypothetical protein
MTSAQILEYMVKKPGRLMVLLNELPKLYVIL